MAPDGQTEWTDGRKDGRKDGRRQNYIPPTSSGDNNHYAKFENKEMEAVGVTDYTNQTPSKHFTGKILSSRPQK